MRWFALFGTGGGGGGGGGAASSTHTVSQPGIGSLPQPKLNPPKLPTPLPLGATPGQVTVDPFTSVESCGAINMLVVPSSGAYTITLAAQPSALAALTYTVKGEQIL